MEVEQPKRYWYRCRSCGETFDAGRVVATPYCPRWPNCGPYAEDEESATHTQEEE
jgi:hypothetical protein